MKISNNWLKQYIQHGLSPEELAGALTMSGLEVDDIEVTGSSLEGVVVGKVLEARPHPNADRLTLCKVDLGSGEAVQIVCGAPNVAQGQKAPVATTGTTLMLSSKTDPSVREPFTLKKVKLRGEVSEGMICSEDELGLSFDHSGIMVLPESAPVGQPFGQYLESVGVENGDAVLDISITPNRPDATSHLGIARDLGALTGAVFLKPEVALPDSSAATAEQISIEIHAPEACGRYAAMLVRGVKVGESPMWLKQRLTAIGLRPRNNVVDITNFVMYECGQPLHAFDYDRLKGAQIIVRLSEAGESFVTLDGKQRDLPQGTLLICDGERPVALAGIMGGENSEVVEETTNVLLESAYFDPRTIRKAVKALGLLTDAAYRFERGVDPEGQVWAAARAADLIAALTGGKVAPGIVDAHPVPVQPREVLVRPSRIKHVLGVEIPLPEVVQLLEAIGFVVTQQNPLEKMAENMMEGRSPDVEMTELTLACTVPSFRPDIEREIDVIEEVARLYGYDRIPEPERSVIPNLPPHVPPAQTLRNHAERLLVGLGYREIYTNSMLRKEAAEQFCLPAVSEEPEQGEIVETLNPISQEMAALRPSLLPGALQVIRYNQNHGQRLLRFFEFGHVFRRSDNEHTLVPGYAEHESLIVTLSGPADEAMWDAEQRMSDFFDLKGIVEAIFEALRLPQIAFDPSPTDTPLTAYHTYMEAGGTPLGIIARLSDSVANALDLKEPVYFAELNWQALVATVGSNQQQRYMPVSRFPSVERDLALLVDRKQAVGPLLQTIRKTGGTLLQNATVFDLYEGDRIEQGKKSIAFSLSYSADRTLLDEEVDASLATIVQELKEIYNASLRQ